MEKLYFRYGNGKTADLCQTAYNYREAGAKVIVMNADNNKEIVSRVKPGGKSVLTLEPNAKTDHIFEQGSRFSGEGVAAILVDNAHLLTVKQVEQLFYLCKTYDITVFAYGNRKNELDLLPSASKRFMELADKIESLGDENVRTNHARFQFFYGAMNACKTSQLLYRAYDLEKKGLHVRTIKPSIDRSVTEISSRIGLSRKADVVLGAKDRLYGDGEYFAREHVNHILVDEAQFLTTDQINDLARINHDFNIAVSCYGLRTDFLTHSFDGSARLLTLAELYKIRTICNCAKHGAEFNARRHRDGEYITSGDQIAVDDGGDIVYESLCEGCYIEKVQGIDLKNPDKVLRKLLEMKIVS